MMHRNNSKVDRRVKKNRIKTILLILLLLCTVTSIIILKTDIFHIKTLEIYGNEKLSKEEVLTYAENAIGYNIFKIKVKKVRENLLRNPYIKTAEIQRKLPDQLVIEIIERKEAAVVPFMGNYLIIDDEGIVLKGDTQASGLKVIKGLEFSNFMEGSMLQVADREQLNKALLVVKAMERVQTDVKEIHVTNKKNIIVRLNDNLYCKLGEGNNLNYKLQLLINILSDLQSKDITRGVIDISHEGYPSYRPVE